MILLPELFTAQAWTLRLGPSFYGKGSILEPLLWPPRCQSERPTGKSDVTSAANLPLQDNLPSSCTGPALLRLLQHITRVSPHSCRSPHGVPSVPLPLGECLHEVHPTLPAALYGLVSLSLIKCPLASPCFPGLMDSAVAIG